MTDPLGLIGDSTFVGRTNALGRTAAPSPTPNHATGTPGFRELLEQQIAQVNELQNDAKEAAEDWASGRRDDVEGVILATQKADLAFRMLLQVRNKMMDAYEEIKQIRV